MSVKEHKEKENVHEHEKPVVQAQHQEQASATLTQVGDIYPFKAAEEPFPQPEDTPDTPPWEKAEFKRKVQGAGFPGSPASDGAFLQALYKFVGGDLGDKIERGSAAQQQEHKERTGH